MSLGLQRLPIRPLMRGLGWSFLGGLRLLLILLLLVDQIGAPLHQHQHDSGVDASWQTAAHAEAEEGSHVESPEHRSTFQHATLAVRTASESSSAKLLADPPSDGSSSYVLVALWTALALAEPLEEDRPYPEGSREFSRTPSPRSLPPAGRAPPLHV